MSNRRSLSYMAFLTGLERTDQASWTREKAWPAKAKGLR